MAVSSGTVLSVPGPRVEIILRVITRSRDVTVGSVGATITSGGVGVGGGEAKIITDGAGGVGADNLISGVGANGGVDIVPDEVGVDGGANKITGIGDPWVAQWFGACLWPRAQSWSPGINSHIGLPAWSLLLPLPLSLSLSLSTTNK